jgi:2-polyprenyl-3-methyl-5-hydroxy-6-metoxy-1,4-benzoquinol methylase
VNILESMEALEKMNSGHLTEAARINVMGDCVLQLPPEDVQKLSLNPFGEDYKNEIYLILAKITKRANYDPQRDEQAPFLSEEIVRYAPTVYSAGDSVFLGDIFQSFGAVFKALNVKVGDSVLEYGCGDGQIALNLSRMGCRVTAVDIEGRYIERINEQARLFHTKVLALQGEFGIAEPGITYDRILFFEAFHHALEHQKLLPKLRSLLSEGGFIVFAGEPILSADNYFRQTLPYPWGPRLDGLSLVAMKTYGWCELGFQREYFIDLLMRSGFLVTFRHEPSTDRGSAYLATISAAVIEFGKSFILEANDMPDCWHVGEGQIRWSKTPVAGIPIDRSGGWRQGALQLHNYLPVEKKIELVDDYGVTELTLAHGESITHTFSIAADGNALKIFCPVHSLSEIGVDSTDTRRLGIAISTLTYR